VVRHGVQHQRVGLDRRVGTPCLPEVGAFEGSLGPILVGTGCPPYDGATLFLPRDAGEGAIEPRR
jgi:hypothetical protein